MTTLATLADRGFVFQTVLAVNDLPDWIANPIRAADIDLRYFTRLIMLGQGGRGLWDSMEAEGYESDNRFDDYARTGVAEFAASMGEPAWEIIYPSDVLLPLGRMAEFSGWGAPSPLGLTINDTFGLWLAHRVVFLIDADIPVSTSTTTHPCTTCADAPCVSACPVGAVSTTTGFDVDACSNSESRMALRARTAAWARIACPIGPEHRYGDAQMVHHYASGLASIRQWYGGGAA